MTEKTAFHNGQSKTSCKFLLGEESLVALNITT
jgi:hypothetical protein